MSKSVKPSELPNEVFNQAFEEALKKNAGDLKLTEKEQENFAKAMKKPEFTDMLKEYMDEISDPKHREEQEAYIRQLEKENKLPDDRELIQPEGGFCVKTRILEGGDSKCFINICISDKVESASPSESKENGTKGQAWSIPYSIGPLRHEHDNKKVAQPTIDFCIHSETFALCHIHPSFHKMVIETAIDAVSARCTEHFRHNVKLDPKYKVLKGVKAMGGKPAILHVSKRDTPLKNKTNQDPSQLKKNTNQDPSQLKKNTNQELNNNNNEQEATVEIQNSDESNTVDLKPKAIEPRYTLVHRGVLDIGDFVAMGSPLIHSSVPKRPKEIVLKIQMPRAKSAKNMELDVSDLKVCFRCPIGTQKDKFYELKLALPYPVNDKKGAAQYDKDKKILTVTLPVLPPVLSATSTDESKESVASKEEAYTCKDEAIDEQAAENIVEDSSEADSTPASNVVVSKTEHSSEVDTNTKCVDTQRTMSAKGTYNKEPLITSEHTSAIEDCTEGSNESLIVSKSNCVEATSAQKTPKQRFDDPILQAAYEASLKPLPVMNSVVNSIPVSDTSKPPTAPSESRKVFETGPQQNVASNAVGNEFMPSESFDGCRHGFVFKLGNLGLGYYKDVQPVRVQPSTDVKILETKPATTTTSSTEADNVDQTHISAAVPTFRLSNTAIFDLE